MINFPTYKSVAEWIAKKRYQTIPASSPSFSTRKMKNRSWYSRLAATDYARAADVLQRICISAIIHVAENM